MPGPKQQTTLDELPIEDTRWNIPPVLLAGTGIWFDRPMEDSIRVKSDRQVRNAQPLGEWAIELQSHLNAPWGRILRSKAGVGIPFDPVKHRDFLEFATPRDIVLALTLAVR